MTFTKTSFSPWLWALALVFLITACISQPISYQRYDLTTLNETVEAAPATYSSSANYDNDAYLPDTLHPEYTPRRGVMINIHIMNTQDTFYKIYEGEAGTQYMKNLVATANQALQTNKKSTLMPTGMDVPVYPFNFKIYLAKKPGTNEAAIYRHYDDELYPFIFRGPKRNLGDRKVLNKYGVNLDTELNIFVMPPHVDSLDSKTFRPNEGTGVFLGKGIKLSGLYPEKFAPWRHQGNLLHEIGHALGLNHAWRNDGCDDTREHSNNCWSKDQSARCDTMTSNNLMDYSAKQHVLTPCQIGRIHARFGNLKSRSRDWLRRDWCKPARDEKEITIAANISWAGARDLNTHIRIKTGGRLYIDNRLHLARGRKITVEPGGILELGPKAWLHNDCEENWAGIDTGNNGREYGEVIIDPLARVENTEL
ncbi:hypothetical protein CEQ90_09350 [Lewinellaceae bacterium SD302]|nr:hypothetical protein CEQ90_09350 [Lewinellaceae bacterium SD302]